MLAFVIAVVVGFGGNSCLFWVVCLWCAVCVCVRTFDSIVASVRVLLCLCVCVGVCVCACWSVCVGVRGEGGAFLCVWCVVCADVQKSDNKRSHNHEHKQSQHMRSHTNNRFVAECRPYRKVETDALTSPDTDRQRLTQTPAIIHSPRLSWSGPRWVDLDAPTRAPRPTVPLAVFRVLMMPRPAPAAMNCESQVTNGATLGPTN